MCVSCLTLSALTLFTPVSETPQPVALQTGAVREIVYTQAPALTVAQETQAAIATMLQQLPVESELHLLRSGLETLQVRLNQAKTDAEAEAMIDQELAHLQQRVLASPSAERIIAVLRGMVLEENTLQSQRGSEWLLSGKPLTAAPLIGATKHWGWL